MSEPNVQPADAALLRACADVATLENAARLLDTAFVHSPIAARLRALAGEMEKMTTELRWAQALQEHLTHLPDDEGAALERAATACGADTETATAVRRTRRVLYGLAFDFPDNTIR